VGPYDFVMMLVDQTDFSIWQLYSDDSSASILNHEKSHFYLFALQIFPAAKNPAIEEKQKPFYLSAIQ